jgi:hypothetical protein
MTGRRNRGTSVSSERSRRAWPRRPGWGGTQFVNGASHPRRIFAFTDLGSLVASRLIPFAPDRIALDHRVPLPRDIWYAGKLPQSGGAIKG